jgi:hypothetical protein
MATQTAQVEPRVIVTHPNRDKPVVQSTRAVVVLLLLATAGLIALITATGWEVLEGATPVEIGYIAVYLLLAFLAARWNRGALPVAAALAVFLLIFAAVAASGWFGREKAGFAEPALDPNLLGFLTLLIIPLQLLLVFFAIRGLQQGWNVEVERRVDEPAPRVGGSDYVRGVPRGRE